MSSKLGLHWLKYHQEARDLEHIEAMQYRSVKIFEWHWNNRDACNDLLAVLPTDSYILARDQPLSEQKQDMWHDPVGTGRHHANEWADKVHNGKCFLPTDRTFFLGINEPDATHGDRNAIDLYTEAFLNQLKNHGLRGGAFNFSTGHPRTVDGTPNTPPDYSVFERSHGAIVWGHHIAVAHIYGTASTPCAPGHYDRLKSCTWTDVEWVIGECGADEHVIGGGPHDGYLISMSGHINDYCGWLDELILGINDGRIHSYQVFTYDFSHPWDSFDLRPIRSALESYQWRHMSVTPPKPEPPEPEPPQPTGKVVHPLPGSVITQHWGEGGDAYLIWGMWAHNGTDFGREPEGTPIACIADGVVVYNAWDEGYGYYCRVAHDQLGVYSFYAHLLTPGTPVGTVLKAGESVGLLGSSGNSTGVHLHLEIRLMNVDGSYSELSPMPKGRCDPETWMALHGLKL